MAAYDEKRPLKDGGHPLPSRQEHPHRLRLMVVVMVACVVLLTTFQSLSMIPVFTSYIPTDDQVQRNNGKGGDSVFLWQNIVPTRELVYHSCYGDYECARLEVPMSWQRTDAGGSKVAVAIIRLRATVPVTDARYGGGVLTNPGGPGGSGVEQVLLNGRATQVIIDSEVNSDTTGPDSEHRYHDIIGFDPRGIGQTTPGVQCFPDSFSREAWGMQNEALGLLGSSEDSFMRNWYRSKALAEGCSAAIGIASDGGDAIGEHVNSSPVARDMLEIVERHAEWVEKQGKLAQTAHDMKHGRDKAQAIAQRTHWTKGKEKIKYWGNSYGTILGQTFASMFPDRVERLILDGVCDSHDYYFGPWFSALKDVDKVLDKFCYYCFQAGPEDCSYFASGGPEAIREAYQDLLQEIFDHPRAVPSSATRGPDVITWSDVKSMIRLGMYLPLIYMPMVADLLTDISKGNGSLFADFKHVEHTPSCPTVECEAAGPFSPECNDAGDNEEDASLAILCTDCEGLGDVDEVQFQEYWHALQNQSTILGDWWAHTRLGCVGWKTRAKWRFPGPFAGNTSHPMLFIGNTLDPVTPLDNAVRMSANFPGSALLQQDSEGHTSWSSPSLCTAKIARTYFQTGHVPESGTICGVERQPFQRIDAYATQMTESDRILANALKVVQKTYMRLKFGSRSAAS